KLEKPRTVGGLELALVGVDIGRIGKLAVDGLQPARHGVVHHHEVPRGWQRQEEVYAHNIAALYLALIFQHHPLAVAFHAVFTAQFHAGIDRLAEIGARGVAEARRVVKPPFALAVDFHLCFGAYIIRTNRSVKRDLPVAEVVKARHAELLALHAGRHAHGGFGLLIDATVL